uniref:C2H2-type domain-containing protein n=2 Tax=Timema TaxID=61471 RepID=A0A7R9FWT1_TIMSH|nr:unnamed protein product [Timema shepardi]
MMVEPQDFTPQTTLQDNIPHGRRQLKPRKINTSSFKSKTVCQKINSYEHSNMSGNLRHSTLCKRSKSHLCKVCGKSYTTKGSLLLHTNIHKGQRFNCKKCGMTFTYKSNLRSHLLRHLGFMLFKCETCGKNFNQNSNLTRHKMIHEEEVLFKCRWCAKSFTQNSYLETHSRFHCKRKLFHCRETKKDIEKRWKCEDCGKSFALKSILRTHIMVHNKDKLFDLKAFKCEECGMNFALKCRLKCHSLKHSKQLLFVCEVCGKSFNQKRYLTMHKVIHNEHKLFECEITPISVGSVQRRRASNSARLGEELRVRLDKARGGLEAQIEHEQPKLDHIKRILQLKLEKKLEIPELRLHNERECNCVAASYEELHNITVQNLHAARSRQETVNQVLLENESWLSGSWNSTH